MLLEIQDINEFPEFDHVDSEITDLFCSLKSADFNVLVPLCEFISLLRCLDHYPVSRVLASRLELLIEEML